MIENKTLVLIKMANGDNFNFQDISEAIKNANFNLEYRYHCSIFLKKFKKDEVLLEIKGILKGNIGNHLHGISNYLLNKNYSLYSNKKVGKRLLIFKEISNEFIDRSIEINEFEKFQLIEDFINLVKNSDNIQNLEKINKITKIINEK